MPQGTSWYYRPTNSPRYLSVVGDSTVPGPRTQSAGSTRQLGAQVNPDVHKNFLSRISRPTMSSRYRCECPRISVNYTGRWLTWDDHYVWSRMNNYQDDRKCLWSRHGALKTSSRI